MSSVKPVSSQWREKKAKKSNSRNKSKMACISADLTER
jgi:hypothetical protein